MITYYVGLCSSWSLGPYIVVTDDIGRMPPSLSAEPGVRETHYLAPLEAAKAYVRIHDLEPRIAVNVDTRMGCIELALIERYWATSDLTYYHLDTRLDVLLLLQKIRYSRKRVRLWYGDNSTGQCWGDHEDGYIGRSTGSKKIPLSIFNTRSTGGGGILTNCIVKIQTTKGKDVLWQHPNYKPFACPYCDSEHGVQKACLSIP